MVVRKKDHLLSVAQRMFCTRGFHAVSVEAILGEAGVARVLEIFRADLERTLKLLGCDSVSALDQSYVRCPESWRARK